MKKNKLYMFLLASVFSFNAFSFSSVDAAFDSNYYNNYSFTNSNIEESTDGTKLEQKEIVQPSAGASNAEIEKYIKDTLNSNSPLASNIQLKGKKQNDDGTSYVAIRYDDGDSKRDVVVSLDSSGDFSDGIFTGDNESSKLQALYDEIAYSQSSSTANDIENLDNILHENSDTYMSSLADFLGIDIGTATSTAAGAMSIFGMAILGAGTNNEKKTEIFNQAIENKKNKLSKPKNNSSTKLTPSSSENAYQKAGAGVYVDCSSGGVDSLTQPTQNFLNTITSRFYEKTGVILNITSTLRPNDTGSWHSEGIAFDVANDEFLNGANGYSGNDLRAIYKQMALDMGGTPLDEYPGGEGEQYARGWNFHITVHNQEDWA